MMVSVAYYNHSRWVADCPVDFCGDARALYPEVGANPDGSPILSPHPVYVTQCANGHQFRIDAPPDDRRAQIETALSERPGQYRDWLPAGHRWASAGHP